MTPFKKATSLKDRASASDRLKKTPAFFTTGFTLVELVVYAAGMALLLVAIVTMLSEIYGLYRVMTIGPRADRVGVTIVDRIIKDIRTGQAINLGDSSFNSPTGAISIQSSSGGSLLNKRFAVSNERITYQENGGSVSFVSPKDMSVSSFRFYNITTSISQGVRFEIAITYVVDGRTETRNYTGVSILRNSYE